MQIFHDIDFKQFLDFMISLVDVVPSEPDIVVEPLKYIMGADQMTF